MNQNTYLFKMSWKLKIFNWDYLIGKIPFGGDGTQNYSVFQPMDRYFKTITGFGNDSYIYCWKSKGLSDERIHSIKTANHSITPNLSYYGTQTKVEFSGNCLKQDKVTFNHGKVVNIYIVYEICNINLSDHPTLEICLFFSVTLTKIADIDKYKISGNGIGFDRHGSFSFPGTELVKSVIKQENRKKDILILGKGPTQGLV